MLRNRYRLFSTTLRKTLPALRDSMQFRSTVQLLRGTGWLDWHILTAIANIVMNYRHSLTGRDPRHPGALEEMARLAFEPEDDSAPLAPTSMFTPGSMEQARRIAMMSLVRHWGLECHQQTPDFAAIESVLAARYGYWDHDVEHEDPFP